MLDQFLIPSRSLTVDAGSVIGSKVIGNIQIRGLVIAYRVLPGTPSRGRWRRLTRGRVPCRRTPLSPRSWPTPPARRRGWGLTARMTCRSWRRRRSWRPCRCCWAWPVPEDEAGRTHYGGVAESSASRRAAHTPPLAPSTLCTDLRHTHTDTPSPVGSQLCPRLTEKVRGDQLRWVSRRPAKVLKEEYSSAQLSDVILKINSDRPSKRERRGQR